jgi:hypothetical protein
MIKKSLPEYSEQKTAQFHLMNHDGELTAVNMMILPLWDVTPPILLDV